MSTPSGPLKVPPPKPPRPSGDPNYKPIAPPKPPRPPGHPNYNPTPPPKPPRPPGHPNYKPTAHPIPNPVPPPKPPRPKTNKSLSVNTRSPKKGKPLNGTIRNSKTSKLGPNQNMFSLLGMNATKKALNNNSGKQKKSYRSARRFENNGSSASASKVPASKVPSASKGNTSSLSLSKSAARPSVPLHKLKQIIVILNASINAIMEELSELGPTSDMSSRHIIDDNDPWIPLLFPTKYLEYYSPHEFIKALRDYRKDTGPVLDIPNPPKSLIQKWHNCIHMINRHLEYVKDNIDNRLSENFYDEQLEEIKIFCMIWHESFVPNDHSHFNDEINRIIYGIGMKTEEILKKRKKLGIIFSKFGHTSIPNFSSLSQYELIERGLLKPKVHVSNQAKEKQLKEYANIEAQQKQFALETEKRERKRDEDRSTHIRKVLKSSIKEPELNKIYGLTNETPNDDKVALHRLISIWNEEIDNIMDELREIKLTHTTKKGHWIWWIFPINHTGRSDQLQTYLTYFTAETFLKHIDIKKWAECIQLISEIIREHRSGIPKIDFSRMNDFCIFWLFDEKFKGVPKPIQKSSQKLYNAMWRQSNGENV